MQATQTHLIPIQELTPGMIASIRNSVITQVVALTSKELNMPESALVVRDIRPYGDLGIYSMIGTAASSAGTEDWYTTASVATVTAGYSSMTGAATMGDQRYVALFGVRDKRGTIGQVTLLATATGLPGPQYGARMVSLIKINVGGADKVIWDTDNIEAYPEQLAGFAPAAVIIPQNASYNISYYIVKTTTGDSPIHLQLIGVVVEPRGKVISP